MAKVKICGIRDPASAVVAAEAGADLIGLGFVRGSRRRVDETSALRIISAVRSAADAVKVVGLFADQPPDEVSGIAGRCGLDMVQLCGAESLEYCEAMEVPVIKVLHVPGDATAKDSVGGLYDKAAALGERGHWVTLDSKMEGLQGGTGRSFDWDIARELSQRGLSFLLAGGLTPENVGSAVDRVRPWGLDVSSGVETDGAKDSEKIRAFIRAARAAGVAGR